MCQLQDRLSLGTLKVVGSRPPPRFPGRSLHSSFEPLHLSSYPGYFPRAKVNGPSAIGAPVFFRGWGRVRKLGNDC
jgi:hypothetical protein